jgi:large subunit ribosomal protein L23
MTHLSSIIIGPVVTEKAERLKAMGVYTLKVRNTATKVDVKNALRRYYDVEVASIRVLNTVPKVRILGAGKTMEKRHRSKHVLVRLGKKSKTLDLSTFKAS